MWQPISSFIIKKAGGALIQPRILLADDDPTVTDQVTKLLTKSGFVCRTVTSGRDCLNELLAQDYDLLLAEILVPEVDGYDICRFMRGDFRLFSIPIVFLTIMKDKNEILKSFELGVDDYICKPFQSSELLARIRGALIRSQKNLDLNALTRLPGQNIGIRKISTLIEDKELFCAGLVDVRGLREFNRGCGYESGDALLLLLARVVRETVGESGSKLQFVCHLGGDDFLFLVDAEAGAKCCSEIQKRFSKRFSTVFTHAAQVADKADPEPPALSFSLVSNEYGEITDHRRLFDELHQARGREVKTPAL